MKECVAVDCNTIATTRVQNSLLMRMKFYLNIDVSKQESEQMMRFIRDNSTTPYNSSLMKQLACTRKAIGSH